MRRILLGFLPWTAHLARWKIPALGAVVALRSRALVLALASSSFWSASWVRADAERSDLPLFRIGVSLAGFGTMNANDAKAALKVWGASVVKERGLPIQVAIEILEGEEAVRRGLAREDFNGYLLTTAEYLWTKDRPSHVFLSKKNADCSESYVVLVHAGGGVTDLAELRGLRMTFHAGSATTVARPWLEVLLRERGLGGAKAFFGDWLELENPSKTVLRLFFRQTESCLVTRASYDLACELNPQLRRQLKELAVSPPLIPFFVYWRQNFDAVAIEEIEAALLELHTSVTGRQVLTVLQSSRFEKHPVSALEPTLELLRRQREGATGAAP